MLRSLKVTDESPQVNGFVVVDKESGWTSHDVVARIRKKLNTRKVGHSGTLDPPATGLLILGVGRATRLLKFITDLPKCYTATMILGKETTTLDAEGEITDIQDPSAICLEDLQKAASNYLGETLQIPPMVSAVKVGGKRLYEIAREGKEIDRQPRPVTIFDLTIATTIEKNVYELDVTCGSGTYIRSLVSDIVKDAGTIAYVGDLRRSSVGSFTETDANPIEEIKVIGMTEGLRDYPHIKVNQSDVSSIQVGKVFEKSHFDLKELPEPWVFTDDQGKLLAIYKQHKGGTIKPDVVIPTDT